MFHVKNVIVTILCLASISLVTGCGTATPIIYGELLPTVSLPAFTSSWEETVTNTKVNTQSPVYYFDANNQIVGIKTVPQASTATATVEVISDTLVKGQEVTLSKITTTSSQGSPVTLYLNATLVEGGLVKNGNQITVTYTLSAQNLQDDTTLTTTTTRTGTVSADGTTITFTQISLQSTPAQTTDTTTQDASTWVLKTGSPLL
jgi:hypothetical protein